jgi:OCT family organic cation transporter-like MFS transporter 4/5
MALTLITLGTASLILAFIPKTMVSGVLVFYLIGKFSAGAGFNMVYLYTGEVFPTNLRTQALGFCSMVARIFCLCAPFLAPLSSYWQPLPMLILGIPTVISGFLTLMLPETSGKDLPQTMKEAKQLELHEMPGKHQENNNIGKSNEEDG